MGRPRRVSSTRWRKLLDGVIVVLDVTEEVELAVQHGDQRFGPGAAESADGHTLFDLVGQLIQTSDIAIYVQPRVSEFADQESQFLRTVLVRPHCV